MQAERDEALKQLNYIAGHINGIRKMVEEDQYCVEILKQTYAVKRALDRFDELLLRGHLAACVPKGFEEGCGGSGRVGAERAVRARAPLTARRARPPFGLNGEVSDQPPTSRHNAPSAAKRPGGCGHVGRRRVPDTQGGPGWFTGPNRYVWRLGRLLSIVSLSAKMM